VNGETIVRVADMRTGTGDDILVTIGLGSCVAILLHDPVARVGGLAHVLLPSPALSRQDANPAKFPQTAIPRLLELMGQQGAKVRMFASLAAPGTIQMGERNLVACRQTLHQQGVALTGQATGGDYGRTVRLWVMDGRVEVSTVARGTHDL